MQVKPPRCLLKTILKGVFFDKFLYLENFRGGQIIQGLGLVQSNRLHLDHGFSEPEAVLHSCQNILSEKKQWTFFRRQEVLLSPKDKLSRVVGNYPVLEV